MSDRELLEMAAKAAAIQARWHDIWNCFVHCNPHNVDNPPTAAGQRHIWDPLTDDGDALRLAVRLQMIVCVRAEGKTDAAVRVTSFITPWRSFMEDHEADPYAATRRAIVRAAAAIGKEMP